MNTNLMKQRLLAERAAIEQSIDRAKESSKPVMLDQTMVGRVSRIDAIQQQHMALATQQRRVQRLALIDCALERIEQKDYGYCSVCDEPIAEKRLNLDPAIATCIQCAGSSGSV